MNFKTIKFPIRMDNELTFLSEIDPIALLYWNAYWALPDDLLRKNSTVWDWHGEKTCSRAELTITEDQTLALLEIVFYIHMSGRSPEPDVYALFFEDDIILFHVCRIGTLEYKDLNNIRESDQVVGVIVQPFTLPDHLEPRRQEIESVLFEIFRYAVYQRRYYSRDKSVVGFSVRFNGVRTPDYSYNYSHEISIPINNKNK